MTVINTNMNAQLTANSLMKNERAMSQTMERLSTGLRINSAADDAAGLGIATRMEKQVNGLNQAVRNANDAISMIATADGAAGEISNMLQRMRELSVQASSNTISAADVTNIDVEFKQLATGIQQIATNTQYNGMAIMDGTGFTGAATDGAFSFNLGTDSSASQVETLAFSDFDLNGGAAVAAALATYQFAGISDATLTTAKQEGTDITLNIDGAVTTIDVSEIGTDATKATTSIALTDANVAAFLDAGDSFSVLDGNAVTYNMDSMETFTSVSEVVDQWNDDYAASSGLTASETISAAGASTHFVLTQTADPRTAAGNVMDVSDIVFTFADDATTAVGGTAIADGIQTHVGAVDSAVATLTVANVVAASPHNAAVNGFNITDNGGVLQAAQAVGAAFSGTMTSSAGAGVESIAGVTASSGGVMGADLSGMVAANATITSKTTAIGGQDASDVIALLDAALTGLESQRATFGAMQNRLEHAVDNLTNVSQNTSASLSRIQDADYAAETSELARTQIISQAATAMLSQANQQAQSVLALLK